MEIRVLVSDLGNVLLPLEPERAYRALAAASRHPEGIAERVRQVAVETGIGRGGASPEAFYQRLAAALGLQLDFATFCRVWSDIFREDAATVALVRQARVERRYLLSNTDPIHWEWIRQRHPRVLEPFDALFASHECGLEKPDPAIYRRVLAASGLPPAAHLYVDDLPEYVAAARAVGMDAVCFTGSDHLHGELVRRGLLAPETR
ncbi:MAG: HAD family phosphatase [Armatimonadetes bacterium]|jgi:FMN phosphatase YigB (HAD superfamily)|nr:HAD family phosphatase [Armatimonadota bacterium]